MIFSIVIILIVALVIVAIVVNAVQQHRDKMEAEKRTEIAKQKSVIDESEDAIMASTQISISPKVVLVLYQRVLNALYAIRELNPSMMEIKQRISTYEEKKKAINVEQPPPADEAFVLPDNDKLVIQYIKAIKKFRVLLRSEYSKGKVDSQTFMEEDQRLGCMQLRVNVETLAKRGAAAIASEQMGSARQYFEKAIIALGAQAQQDEYTNGRRIDFENQLRTIQDSLRNANTEDRLKKQEEERNDLDELFAPKRKW
jgi:hypothetical protein